MVESELADDYSIEDVPEDELEEPDESLFDEEEETFEEELPEE